MGITIKDIAERARVSSSTVSLALNNKGGIGEETRKRIREIATDLNYTNPLRPPDRSQRTDTIRFLRIARHGRIVNRDHTVFISDYIDGIVQASKELEYKAEVAAFSSTPIDEIVETIQFQTDIAGAIVLGTELDRNDILRFKDASVPVVFIDTFVDYAPFDFVDMNNIDSVFMVIEHLLRFGHSEIGIVQSQARTRNFTLRERAFEAGMESFGMEIDQRYVFQVDSTFQGAHDDMAALLDRRLPLPTALFCANDIIAFGVLKALREHGLRVPADISVVGFDDLPAAAHLDPPLTSVAVSKRQIGSTAVRRLYARIQDSSMAPTKTVIGGCLMERESVARVGKPIEATLHDSVAGISRHRDKQVRQGAER